MWKTISQDHLTEQLPRKKKYVHTASLNLIHFPVKFRCSWFHEVIPSWYEVGYVLKFVMFPFVFLRIWPSRKSSTTRRDWSQPERCSSSTERWRNSRRHRNVQSRCSRICSTGSRKLRPTMLTSSSLCSRLWNLPREAPSPWLCPLTRNDFLRPLAHDLFFSFQLYNRW